MKGLIIIGATIFALALGDITIATNDDKGQMIQFEHLGPETQEWLEWLNGLTPEEQKAISCVPAELQGVDNFQIINVEPASQGDTNNIKNHE